MRVLHDAGHLPEMNREHTAGVTTPRPIARSCRDVAATHASRGELPKATRRHPADVEGDDKGATVVVPVTAPVCDDVTLRSEFQSLPRRGDVAVAHPVRLSPVASNPAAVGRR
jgi:hypothetical protein